MGVVGNCKAAPVVRIFTRLDAYGTDDPDFNEGHHTDRCPLALCGRPVIDHPSWRHRLAALIAIMSHR